MIDRYQMKDGIFQLNDKLIVPTGRLILTLRNVITGEIDEQVLDNMFVTAGKNSIARGLQGDTTSGFITYCAVGTSSVAPALGDTGLTAEIARKQISVRSFLNNVATFQTYFTTLEGNGTLREIGLFGDSGAGGASATPGSGTLFNKAAINRSKTTNDTLTATWTVTIG